MSRGYSQRDREYYLKNRHHISETNRLKREAANPPDVIDSSVFKNIPGMDGQYSISKDGVVISHLRYRDKILLGGMMTSGYRYVNLVVKGRGKNFSIHRLVAMTYLPNTDKLPQVNHKNADKLNNNVDNLEWCTQKHNNNHAFVLGNQTRNKLGQFAGSKNNV